MITETIECDVTDAWLESTDPENEFGECAEAYLEFDDITGAEVVSVSVDDGSGFIPMKRAIAIQCMGIDAIYRIEKSVNAERGYF